jgi:nondiscriminating aspartyl-tRNA synthetase
VEIQVPKLTGNDAEGGAAVFEVKYFDHKATLATSPQLYKQIMVGALERVFTTTSVYRAEKHSTTRHLNEYTTMDLEMGFIKDHTDIMDVEEGFLKYLFEELKGKCAHELQSLGVQVPDMQNPIPRLKLREAQTILDNEYGQKCFGEPDLEPQHERMLCEYAQKKYGSEFIFISHYPVSKRPFYTYEDESDPGFTKSFDLLFRGLEVTTGGQRIHDYDKLMVNIKKWGLNPDNFTFYLQAFKYGMPPEGGLAIGLERLTARILGLDNVKEATLFPRDLNRIDTLLSSQKPKEEV